MLSSLSQNCSVGWSLAGNFAFSWPTTFNSLQALYNTINLVSTYKITIALQSCLLRFVLAHLEPSCEGPQNFQSHTSKFVVNFYKKCSSPTLVTVNSDFVPFSRDGRVCIGSVVELSFCCKEGWKLLSI